MGMKLVLAKKFMDLYPVELVRVEEIESNVVLHRVRGMVPVVPVYKGAGLHCIKQKTKEQRTSYK